MKETLAGGLLQDCARLRTLLLDRIQLMRYNEAELRRLDEAGRVYATPSYKDGQYLYLLHPGTEPGQRGRREYVGNKAEKVREALAKIKNGQQYDELAEQNRKIGYALKAAAQQIEQAIDRLEAVAPLDLATAGGGDFGCTEDPPGGESVTKPVESVLVAKGSIEQLSLSPI